MIDIQNLTFNYSGGKDILKDFSLQINEPGIYGLLGKNGAGKSTLLYLIMGLLFPNKGEIRIDGIDPSLRLPETMENMFIVPEEYNLPGIPLTKYIKALRPFYPRWSDEILRHNLDSFQMPLDTHLGALSMGQKKKIYMSVALATNTHYLLMDEPTNGLDIPSKSQFRKAVSGSMDDEKTIIISTHQVRDVELLLDHLTVIDQSNILLNASMTSLGQHLNFIDINKQELPNDVIYKEESLQGYAAIAPNHGGEDEESPVRLELLFNALLTDAEAIRKVLEREKHI